MNIQSGVCAFGYGVDPGWDLTNGNSNNPSRTKSYRVFFEKPFIENPNVVVAISGLDISKDRNLRVTVKASSITIDGFNIEICSWSDSITYTVQVNWIAFGS